METLQVIEFSPAWGFYPEILENLMWISYLKHSSKALGADSSSYYSDGLSRYNLSSCFPLQMFPNCL